MSSRGTPDETPSNVTSIDRGRTAMSRSALSRPVALAVKDGVLAPGQTFFDYGAGRGGDVKRLLEAGYTANGWDPNHDPTAPRHRADVVNLGYVLNVIESPAERAQVLRSAWALADRVLIVSARTNAEAQPKSARAFGDGVLTSSGTFQHFYTQAELGSFIDTTLGVQAVPAAQGIFYVYRTRA